MHQQWAADSGGGLTPLFIVSEKSNKFTETLRPYDSSNGRYFDFTEFEMLGHEFVSACALGFVRYSPSVSLTTAQAVFYSVKHFFRWLMGHKDELLHLLHILHADYLQATAEDWEDVLALWHNELFSNSALSEISKSNIIRCLNSFLRRLIGFGILPNITFISPPKRWRNSGKPTRTLAELPYPHVKAKLQRALDESTLETNETDSDLQIKNDSLTTLFSKVGGVSGTAEEIAKALMRVNAERLAIVRACAVKDFKKWCDHWHEGQRLRRSCDLAFGEIDEVLNQPLPNTRERSRILAALFPTKDPKTSLARLLTYFDEHPEYCGRMRRQPEGTLKHWFWSLAKPIGLESLQAYLFPHPHLTIATAVITLCDTGANISVIRSLPSECLSDSKESGYKIIQGTKMRAGGKLVINELPVKDPLNLISCVEVILSYLMISARMRKSATENTAKKLLLHLGKKGCIVNVDSQVWHTLFRDFRNRHPELRSLNIESKMIRPSVLLQAAYDKETGILAAASLGDHADISETFRYVSRFPTQIIWTHKIRRFQSLFQAVTIQSIEGAASKLGLRVEQVEVLFNEACRTGLGVVCLAPTAGIQPSSKEGELCTQVQNCPTCQNSFVLATVENLKDLILWNYHLEQSRTEWEAARPERWGTVWLPWLVFTQVAIEQASRGRTVKDFKVAKALADDLVNKGQVNLPPLW